MNLIERLRHPATAQIYSIDVQAMREAANELERLTDLCRLQHEAMKRDVEGQLDEGIEVLNCVKEALAAYEQMNGGE